MNLLPLFLFALTMTTTPGPNNIMLAASGAGFGLTATIRHIFGIWTGMVLLLTLSGLGLNRLFSLLPWLENILRWAGIAYIFYLAFKMALSRGSGSEKKERGQPLTLIQAALFQIINPKALMMTVTAISVYTQPGENYIYSLLILIVVFTVVGFPSSFLWTGFGSLIGSLLKRKRNLKLYNYTMGGLTALSALFLLI